MFISLTYIFFGVMYCLVAVFIAYTIFAFISGAPFLPTSKENVNKIISLASLKTGERMLDLGSGDGRIVRMASKSGALCVGVEISPVLYWWSRMRSVGMKNVHFLREDLWNMSLSDVDVLTLFFIYPKMGKLKEKIIREMKPGARVISYGFRFPDWKYIENDGKVYLYIV